MYCIDASVLTNSEIESEELHEYSRKFMQTVRESGITAVVPEIALPEVSSAIARGTDDPKKALRFADELKQIPNLIFVPVDRELADAASRFAAEYRLRGCDAIYVAAASIFGSKLITLDRQQIEKASGGVEVATPQEELKRL